MALLCTTPSIDSVQLLVYMYMMYVSDGLERFVGGKFGGLLEKWQRSHLCIYVHVIRLLGQLLGDMTAHCSKHGVDFSVW